MFEYVRNNQRLVQLFLALITLPFAFWGVESYVRSAGTGADAATVGGSKITMQEFERALREQQDRLRPALGGRDPALLDSPELRRSVIDGLVTQRLMAVHAAKAKLVISDDQLRQFIMSAPSLQVDGKFSPERYEMLVEQQGLSKEGFEATVRRDIAAQQTVAAIAQAAMPGRTAADRWLAAQLEEREVAEAQLRPDAYAAQVKLAPDAVKNYYEANRKQFETPEQVRAEFLVLSQAKMADQITPGDDEVKAYYQSHADQFKTPEERRASHILVLAKKDAPPAEDKAARAKAEELLAEVKKNPADFAKIAQKNSQDTGSAAKGGDLDWFGRGMMVPAFEQAAFSMKEGEISGLVRSDYGYHIIKVTGIRPERVKPLAEVKAQIVDQLKKDGAAKKYAEMAEGFSNTVYEQADSLKPAAEKYKLNVQTADGWITKKGQLVPPFTNPKLLDALFSEDSVKNRRNTEAIEVAPNTLVSARVVDYKPAAVQPLETVAPMIEKFLVQQEASKLAVKDGEDKLAKLAKGEQLNITWGAPRSIARAAAPGVPPEAVRAIFSADAAKVPAYAGAPMQGGYALYRINQVKPYTPPAAGAEEPPRAKALRDRYRQTVAEAEFGDWLATLKQRYGVEINKAVLEPGGNK
ncbi:MAG TPA: SurA N-terminal domain-containing protein [Rhodocyclaceae bacterium]